MIFLAHSKVGLIFIFWVFYEGKYALKSQICPILSLFINVCLVTGGYVTDLFWFSGINIGISNGTPKKFISFSFLSLSWMVKDAEIFKENLKNRSKRVKKLNLRKNACFIVFIELQINPSGKFWAFSEHLGKKSPRPLYDRQDPQAIRCFWHQGRTNSDSTGLLPFGNPGPRTISRGALTRDHFNVGP